MINYLDFKKGLRFVLLSTENPRPQSEKEMSYITAFDVTDIESDFNQVKILLLRTYVLIKILLEPAMFCHLAVLI